MITIMLDAIYHLFDGSCGQTRRLGPGEFLFHRDQKVAALFMVVAGEVQLIRHQESGGAIILQRAGPSDIPAEASVFSSRYHCDGVARTGAEIRSVAKREFLARFRKDPKFAEAWATHLAREVQNTRFRSEVLSLKTVAGRLDASPKDSRANFPRHRPPEREDRQDDPLRDGGEAGTDHGDDRHQITIGPSFPDLDIEPFAEYGVAESCQDGGQPHKTIVCLRPQTASEHNQRGQERARRNQDIARGAVNCSKGYLPWSAGFPQRVKRHMGELPDQIPDRHGDQVASQSVQPSRLDDDHNDESSTSMMSGLRRAYSSA